MRGHVTLTFQNPIFVPSLLQSLFDLLSKISDSVLWLSSDPDKRREEVIEKLMHSSGSPSVITMHSLTQSALWAAASVYCNFFKLGFVHQATYVQAVLSFCLVEVFGAVQDAAWEEDEQKLFWAEKTTVSSSASFQGKNNLSIVWFWVNVCVWVFKSLVYLLI